VIKSQPQFLKFKVEVANGRSKPENECRILENYSVSQFYYSFSPPRQQYSSLMTFSFVEMVCGEIISSIFGEWLETAHLVMYDSACCNRKQRPILLSLFSQCDFKIKGYFDQHCPDNYFLWVVLRNIKVDCIWLRNLSMQQ
jgi:hypothetical protein